MQQELLAHPVSILLVFKVLRASTVNLRGVFDTQGYKLEATLLIVVAMAVRGIHPNKTKINFVIHFSLELKQT